MQCVAKDKDQVGVFLYGIRPNSSWECICAPTAFVEYACQMKIQNVGREIQSIHRLYETLKLIDTLLTRITRHLPPAGWFQESTARQVNITSRMK